MQEELLQRKARCNFRAYVLYTKQDYDMQWFHALLCDKLQAFADGNIKKLMVLMPPQHGKLLPADTPILTTKGWKSHGELLPGDFVFGQDGIPKKVIANSGIYDWNVDQINLQGGRSILAAKEHVWKLRVEYDDHKGRRDLQCETQDIFKKKNRRSPAIAVNNPLQLPDSELPIDPYILGCWLGDGHSRQGVLTVGKEDVNHFKKLGSEREVKPGIYRVLINGLTTKLKSTGVFLNKHIPDEYLLSSYNQRVRLLQGLMDTDGCCNTRGNCEFTQNDNRLVRDVYTLLRTLGIKAQLNYYDSMMDGRKVGMKGRITFCPDKDQPIFLLPRKQERLVNKTARDRNDKKFFFIESVTDHGIVKGNCIQVDGGMYLAGIDLIPTHNSELTTRLFPGYLLGRDPDKKVVMATYSQTIASNFNRSMQRYIDTEEYAKIFPETKLNYSQIFKTNVDGYTRTTEKFDVIKYKGSVKTVGVGGSLTSEPADICIVDDPLKDREEANSETVRSKLYEWYTDVLKTRMHNGSQQLLIQTRWHEMDLAGRLLQEDDDWDIIKLPAIRTKAQNDYDPRPIGEVLWPGKHSLERIFEIKVKNEVTFNSLYQQDPRPNKEILVYKDWIELPEWPTALTDVSWGLDFGKTTGINALVKGCVTSEITYKDAVDAEGVPYKRPCYNAYLKEYLYSPGWSPLQIAELLKKSGYIEGQIVWCDHMPLKWNELRRYGIAAYPAIKGPGSIESGIDKMNEFQVCYIGKNIKMESDNYQYVTYDNVITNVPVDENNHCFTGDTMICTEYGLKRIDNIATGDMVLTSVGFKPVLIKWNNGKKQVNKYLIDLGTFCLTLTCTKNHLIKTIESWTEISLLQPGATVYLSSFLTAKDIDYGPVADILAGVQKQCTERCGSFTTDQYHPVGISTTKTRTRGIISQIILKTRMLINTFQSICKKGLRKTLNNLLDFNRRVLRPLQNGMPVKRVLNGIGNTQEIQVLENKYSEVGCVMFVQKNLQPKIQNSGFVPIIANQNTGASKDLIILLNHASSVEPILPQINTNKTDFAVKVVVQSIAVLEQSEQEVYDLTVSGHEYFANSILVHNCLDSARYCLLSRFFREGK